MSGRSSAGLGRLPGEAHGVPIDDVAVTVGLRQRSVASVWNEEVEKDDAVE